MIRKAEIKDETAILQLLDELEETKFSEERFHELYLRDLQDERHQRLPRPAGGIVPLPRRK